MKPLGELLTEQAAGEVALKPEETFAQARARVRRASKRAGINVKVWEVDGALRFERVDLPVLLTLPDPPKVRTPGSFALAREERRAADGFAVEAGDRMNCEPPVGC